MQQLIRLPIKNAYNVRDLGGYYCEGDAATRFQTFLRGDDLTALDEEDIGFLLHYGVKTVIDLRSSGELKKYRNPFADLSEVNYFNVPLITGDVDDATKSMMKNPGQAMPEFYVQLVRDQKHLIKEVFDIMAREEEGAVLFHCAAGKDRTGVIAALLLGLAGVEKADIVSNYEMTYTYLVRNPQFLQNNAPYHRDLLLSKAEYIEKPLDFIYESYGDFYTYLMSIGVPSMSLQALRNRFVQKIAVEVGNR